MREPWAPKSEPPNRLRPLRERLNWWQAVKRDARRGAVEEREDGFVVRGRWVDHERLTGGQRFWLSLRVHAAVDGRPKGEGPAGG